MEKKRRKIGIMGGTFDPIHIGHLILGQEAFEQFNLDELWFMPNGNPPHKKNRDGRATEQERMDMVQLAIQDNPNFILSSQEVNHKGYSYTFRTLEILNQKYPDTDFYFIIGADSLINLETWKEPAKILRSCHILVAVRDHLSIEELQQLIEIYKQKYGGSFHILRMGMFDLSSDMIRKRIQKSQSIRYYIPESVRIYIEEHQLYKGLE